MDSDSVDTEADLEPAVIGGTTSLFGGKGSTLGVSPYKSDLLSLAAMATTGIIAALALKRRTV